MAQTVRKEEGVAGTAEMQVPGEGEGHVLQPPSNRRMGPPTLIPRLGGGPTFPSPPPGWSCEVTQAVQDPYIECNMNGAPLDLCKMEDPLDLPIGLYMHTYTSLSPSTQRVPTQQQ